MKNNIVTTLFEMQDSEYKTFQQKLIPSVDSNKVIGVRASELKKIAKTLCDNESHIDFMDSLPHDYYDENTLHSFIICTIKDFDLCICAVEKFLPYVDNWATCDSIRPKIFSKHKNELLKYIYKWIYSNHNYTIRFGIQMLMIHYSDDLFIDEYLSVVSSVKSNDYYVKMMIAWYFSTLLAKQYKATIPYFEKNCLDKWVHNKALQKSLESFRIPKEKKEYLKSLKIKNKEGV